VDFAPGERVAAGSAEALSALVLTVSWLRRHGKSSSVQSRAAPFEFMRRWQVNSYFHTSTVFRKRREALEIYFAIAAGTQFMLSRGLKTIHLQKRDHASVAKG
jgi:hypothetical protein